MNFENKSLTRIIMIFYFVYLFVCLFACLFGWLSSQLLCCLRLLCSMFGYIHFFFWSDFLFYFVSVFCCVHFFFCLVYAQCCNYCRYFIHCLNLSLCSFSGGNRKGDETGERGTRRRETDQYHSWPRHRRRLQGILWPSKLM